MSIYFNFGYCHLWSSYFSQSLYGPETLCYLVILISKFTLNELSQVICEMKCRNNSISASITHIFVDLNYGWDKVDQTRLLKLWLFAGTYGSCIEYVGYSPSRIPPPFLWIWFTGKIFILLDKVQIDFSNPSKPPGLSSELFLIIFYQSIVQTHAR